MYRQNILLNDFINFLKARGRFGDIEFIDNKVKAIPTLPDHPTLVFYQDEDKAKKTIRFTLEVKGPESDFLDREIREFFRLNKLHLFAQRLIMGLIQEKSKLSMSISGSGELYDTMMSDILSLVNARQLTIARREKHLIFMDRPSKATSSKPITKLKPKPRIDSPKRPDIVVKPTTEPTTTFRREPKIEEIVNISLEESESSEIIQNASVDNDQPLFKEPAIENSSENSETESLEKGLFKPPEEEQNRSFLKQSTGLFRKDNWEEDLPSEYEMEILELTYKRIKHRTKPEILAKQINITVEESELILRNLIKKGLLRSQVGWFIIKKSHLPFFKDTFSDESKKSRKKKSTRISRIGEGLTPEEISTIKAIKDRPNLKAQSNLLTKPTGLKQSILKEVLRNLVEKGILRVSYGWYILKDKHILEQKRGKPISSQKKAQKETVDVPENLSLTTDEKKVISALLERPNYKAQSNLLVKSLKMNRDKIKQILRDLVEKDVCRVDYGWYSIQDPSKFSHKP